MALSSINNLGWYVQRLSALVTQNAAQGIAGASASNASAADATGSASSSATPGALSQDLQVFMQALYQALSSTDPNSAQRASASDEAAPYGAPTSPTYAKGRAPNLRTAGYQQGQSALQGKVESLISNLSNQAAGSAPAFGSSPSAGLGGLQDAFNRLMQDLGPSSGSAAARNPAVSGPLNAFLGQGSDLTLHAWLQGLQRNLQQPGGTSFSAVGNLVNVVV